MGEVGQYGDRDATYGQLMWPLVMPAGGVGQLNWVTGVMGLDVDQEVYDNWDNPAYQRIVERAAVGYSHELTHLLQISMTGFTYLWADTLFDLLRPSLSRLIKTEGAGDFSGVVRSIEHGKELLDSKVVETISEHFALLDRPNAWGLTIRALLETQAYLVERRSNGVVSDISDVAPALSQAPAPEYRAAFDLLAVAIGFTAAYHWFDLVCGVALCTAAPARAFLDLALGLASRPGELALPTTPETAAECGRFLGDLVPESLIGFAPQIAAAQDEPNPFFGPHVFALNAAAGRGEIDTMWLLASPATELGVVTDCLTPIVFLRPREPHGFSVSAPDMGQDEVLLRLTMAAVSVQLTREIEAESRGGTDNALAGLRWLRGDRSPVLVEFDSAQIRSHDITPLRLVDPDSHLALPADQLPNLWGRCVLMPPPELDPAEDLHLPANDEIRSYIRYLHSTFPAFPLILSWLPGFGAFFDWFGSLTDGEVDDAGRIAADHSTALAVFIAARAMHELGDRLGQNPGVLIDLLVNQLPIDLRTSPTQQRMQHKS